MVVWDDAFESDEAENGNLIPLMNPEAIKELLRADPFLVGRLLEESSIGPKEMISLALNWTDQPKDRFWCPGCEKIQSHPEMVAPWISPQGRLVCFYLVCRRCSKPTLTAFRAGNRPQTQRVADLIERVLVARYPHIASNLPPAYFASTDEDQSKVSLSGAHLIIPNPVHPAKDGELPQVVCRRYLVVRFLPILELADIDKQSAVVWHLGQRYPLVTICRNGEEPEGLEAWFKVEGWTEEACHSLIEYACTLGADPETFDPQCFVHLPNAVNPATGKQQKLIYFDPKGKNFPKP